MDELYKEYGQLMVQAEILQKRINTVKQKINEQLKVSNGHRTKDNSRNVDNNTYPDTEKHN